MHHTAPVLAPMALGISLIAALACGGGGPDNPCPEAFRELAAGAGDITCACTAEMMGGSYLAAIRATLKRAREMSLVGGAQ